MGEVTLLHIDILLETTEKIAIIQKNICVSQNKLKKYTNKCRVPLEFKMGD